MRSNSASRWSGMLAVASLAGLLVGCDSILKVSNPEQIPVASLDDSTLINAQVAGVISEFQDAYTRNNGAWLWSANFLTDEQVTGLNWEDYARVNQRVIKYTEGPIASLWGGLSRTVRLGEDVTKRIETLVNANDRRIATTQLYAGYGYTLIGEGMCQATFGTAENPGTTVETPTQVFARGITALEKALANATANGRSDIANAARVGLARAYLSQKNFTKVIEHASAVPASFQFWIEFSSAQDAENNGLFGNVHGTNHTMGVSPFFLQGTFGTQNLINTQTDPRIQHFRSWTRGHNGLTQLYKPFQGLRYSDYTGNTIAPASAACPNCTGSVPSSTGDTGPLLLYQKDTDVLLADYLEAQHHLMEAYMRQNQNEAQVLAFVNARRAVGNQAPVALAGAALFAELRTQRSRDTYQGGLRLGDLRRWKRDGIGDFFPTGAHVNQEWGQYGVWTCFPIPLEEYEGNPGLPRPADPNTPPGI